MTRRAAPLPSLLPLFLALGCSSGRAETPPPAPADEVWVDPHAVEQGLRVVRAEARDLPRAVLGAGRVAFDDLHVTHVLSPVTGRVVRVLAQPGQAVRRGAPLATILSPDVGAAFSDLVKAQADLLAAEADLDRQRRLAKVEAASAREVEAAEDAFRKARAEHARAAEKARLLRPGAQDAVTQAYTVRSWLDGKVMARFVGPGSEVQGQYSGGQPAELFTVGDIRSVWILADVADTDVPRVKPGADVTVTVSAYPGRTFHGRVDWVSATLDPAVRTARIRASLANDDEALKPEMYAQVSIATAPRRALAIPRAALEVISGQSFALVAQGAAPEGRVAFRRRLVRTADAGEDWVEVRDGLAAGDEVLVEAGARAQPDPPRARLSAAQLRAAGIRVEPAEERDLPDAISLGGRLAFDDQRVTHVFSPVTGRVTRVLARPGQRVRRGAPLAAIASPEVGSAFADVRKAEADLVQAEHELRRQRELVAARAGARRDLEAAEDAWKKAKAEADRARLKTALLRAGVVDGVTQEFLLTSPIDGEVVARNVNPGVEIQGQSSGASTPVELFTIGDGSRLWVLADAYEVDLPRLRLGDEIEVRLSSLPGQGFRGRIDWISDVLDPQLRTAKVRCTLDNREGLLRPDMYEAITVQVPGRRVVTVPREAVLRVGADRVVIVRKGEADGRVTFERRVVAAEEGRAGGRVPVWSGLAPGEPVVASGAIFVLGAM